MNYKKFLGAASAALMIVVVTLVLASGAWAQIKFKTLYKFTGGKDGSNPDTSLIFDQAGNLYGTANGGAYGGGVVFKLTPNADRSWTESVLHSFNGTDGSWPSAGLIFDQAGNLSGTTTSGGAHRLGIVFELIPNQDGSWTESVLHSFNGTDGRVPIAGLIFDQAGNLYGTASEGGHHGFGVVFELTPKPDGSWTEKTLHYFTGGKDGGAPQAGLTFDQERNLYSTTLIGGNPGGGGVVFKLTPKPDGSWTEKVLHYFTGGMDGNLPFAGLTFDQQGNLYGTTSSGGAHGMGTVFELTPNPDGSWTEKSLHHFTTPSPSNASVVLDQAGNLYGTTVFGGSFTYCIYTGCGVVFKLAPNSTGGWTETVLHRFVDHPGAEPQAGLIFDAAGNLYGTTHGDYNKTIGSVFKITP